MRSCASLAPRVGRLYIHFMMAVLVWSCSGECAGATVAPLGGGSLDTAVFDDMVADGFSSEIAASPLDTLGAFDFDFECALHRVTGFVGAGLQLALSLATSAVSSVRCLLNARSREPLCSNGSTPSTNGTLDNAFCATHDAFVAQLLLLGPPPDDTPAAGGCLADLLKTTDTLRGGDSLAVRPYDPAKLKVVSASRQAVPLAPLLDGDTRVLLDQFDDCILAADVADRDAPDEAPRPYFDPALQVQKMIGGRIGAASQRRPGRLFLPFLRAAARRVLRVW